MSNPKPFKIWSCDRATKKSVTAATLAELINKGRSKLGYLDGDADRVVLESDGTEVDEEDYFTFLKQDTIFLLLRGNESWRQEGKELILGGDEPDHLASGGFPERTRQLIEGLHRDITRIITFSNDDLQIVVDIKTAELASVLQDTESFAASVQESCQRHLDERQQTTEAIDLLRLYHKSRQHSPYVGDEFMGSKRKKGANM